MRVMTGRKTIYTDAMEITDDNVVDELTNALYTHEFNREEIAYLYNYYKGRQPILERVKDIRPEINNRIVENRANEIVSFKVGYLCGEPIQYVARVADETVSANVSRLNEIMFAESKATADKEIVEWQMIAGTAFRLVLPDSDGTPFEIYTLDPRDTFVVYGTDIGNTPVFAVKGTVDTLGEYTYHVYSKDHYWKIKGGIVESTPHSMGVVPIFEYPANNAKLGSFEIVLPLLDALNDATSNRLDGLEQFIQSYLLFNNCDIDAEEVAKLKELGAIKVKSVDGMPASVSNIVNTLDQTQTQTLIDYLYQSILTICGMPNRNGGSSTSDTGTAVVYRDGWTSAEARAKESEMMFIRSEMQMLKLVLRICNDIEGIDLKLSDISVKFTRRNYENIQSKAQVLNTMLSNNKIHPLLAFTHCGMFSDPESAYAMSKKYLEEVEEKMLSELENV